MYNHLLLGQKRTRGNIVQKKQLRTLKSMTGHDFNFVPATQNKFGIKYYEHVCKTDAEYHDIASTFNQYDGMIYTAQEHDDGTCSIIVLESLSDKQQAENITYGYVNETNKPKPIGKLHGNDVFLEPTPTNSGTTSEIVAHSQRAVSIVKINGKRLPFYVSSGHSGKEKEYGIPSGKWYPLQGISEAGWLNKMPDMLNNPYPELDEICKMLEKKFPAEKTKQDAQNGQIPIAKRDSLLELANTSFPEGMPYNERNPYQYYRNHLIYLPTVIDAWRSKPTDYLEITDGPMEVSGIKLLNEIRKTDLIAHIEYDNGVIWLSPIKSQLKHQTKGQTEEDIKQQLYSMGINYSTVITQENKPGFGIADYNFVKYFEAQKEKKYKAAAQRLNAPKQNIQQGTKQPRNTLQQLMQKVRDILDK